MLREAHLARDRSVLHEAAQAGREDLIIHTQPEVEILGLFTVRPPAVQIGLAGYFAQGVNIAEVTEDLVHPGTLRRHETRLVLAVAPVFHVQFQMGGMQRTTIDELAALATLLGQVGGKVVHELEFLVQARIAVAARGQQQAADADLVEIRLDITPIPIRQLEAKPHDDGLGCGLGIDGYAALAGHFRLEAILPVTFKPIGVLFQLGSGDAYVLKADNVRILRAQPVKQTSGRSGLDTVDIKTDYSHTWLPQIRACMIPELKGFLL